jgi:two-component system, OmpR family, response regulator
METVRQPWPSLSRVLSITVTGAARKPGEDFLSCGGTWPINNMDNADAATSQPNLDDGPRSIPPELPAVKILIVDDDKAICEYMQTLLERDGFQVKALSDPTGVEEEVRHGGYHLIILDLMMPKLDGIEVLRRVRKLDTDIAVVIFTGFPNLESAVASMKLDAVDYIKKPFNVDEFREVISRVMRKKGLARTPEEQLHKVIGDTIRNLRKEKDLTLKQMSRRTGLSVSLLSQIERAESSASISSLYKIAIALESRIQDLFGEY